MAITNREIMNNQLKRINDKMNTDYVLKKAQSKGYWYLCRVSGEYDMPPFPLSGSMTKRTSAQMIEYLAGVEDATDFFTHTKADERV